MSRIFQALRQSGKASETPGRPAGNGDRWRDLLSSLESWPESRERSGRPAHPVRCDTGVLEDPSARNAFGQPLGHAGQWQDLAAQPATPPEIVERAENVVCKARAEERVVSSEQFHSSAQEVFRVLCQRLRQVRDQRPLRTVLITGAVPREGRTVVAINLAATLARSSQRVLLVNADLRHPSASALGLPPWRGLADYLDGRVELPQAIRRVEPLGFYYLSAGHSSTNPAELIQKPTLREFMGQTAAAFDWVIFDSPPVNLFAETRHLALLVDGVLLVVREGVTPREAAEKSLAALEGAFVVGLVFNASTNTLHDRYDLAKPSAAASHEEIGPSVGRNRSNGEKSGDD